MLKRIFQSTLIILCMIYIYAIVANMDWLANILSPVLIFTASCYVYYGMVFIERSKIHKWAGVLTYLGVVAWSCCELVWGILAFSHGYPERNIVLYYSYSFTQVFLTFSILIFAYIELKKMDKIQTILDMTIFTICFSVILWVFIFNQDKAKANLILSDSIIMITLLLDTLIFAWISIWYLSVRRQKIQLSFRLIMVGYVCFVLADYIYYYMFFYTFYNPNSWIDGFYMLGFAFMAVGAYIKIKKGEDQFEHGERTVKRTVKRPLQSDKEFLLIAVPLIIFIFKRDQIFYVLYVTFAVLVYYILRNYTQKNILREELLRMGQKHISELEEKVKERTQEIVEIMNTDYITGLYNRRYFDTILADICKNLKENEQVAVLYIDLNKYKVIRSLYGTIASDDLLRNIAERMNRIITGPDTFLASYGEDRFVVVVKSYFANREALSMSEHIINECSELYRVGGNDIRVTFNIGISCFPLDTSTSEDLIKNSDIAMNQARLRGFNKIMMFDKQTDNKVYRRHRLEIKLKKVKYEEEFQLYFQPQVNCKDGSLCGFEALLRWFDKKDRYIPPSEFIPITEETGMIIPLGKWILRKAVEQFKDWIIRYGIKTRIAVNISIKQLTEEDFVSNLNQLMEEYGILPKELEIEITESMELENHEELMTILESIRNKGISIAIDDFGTGYSSLHYLKTLPMDRIKIAKELVDNIEWDIYSKSIIQMVISIAKVKGIKVIAEGVETKEQWDCLKNLECDEIQGYYFQQPMPPDEVETKWFCQIPWAKISGQNY